MDDLPGHVDGRGGIGDGKRRNWRKRRDRRNSLAFGGGYFLPLTSAMTFFWPSL